LTFKAPAAAALAQAGEEFGYLGKVVYNPSTPLLVERRYRPESVRNAAVLLSKKDL